MLISSFSPLLRATTIHCLLGLFAALRETLLSTKMSVKTQASAERISQRCIHTLNRESKQKEPVFSANFFGSTHVANVVGKR